MRNMETYNSEIAKLATRVASLQTVSDSAIALITGLRERINQLITDGDGIVPTEELQKLSSSIDVGTKALAAAVEANTEVPSVPGPMPADPNVPAGQPPETGKPADPANPE